MPAQKRKGMDAVWHEGYYAGLKIALRMSQNYGDITKLEDELIATIKLDPDYKDD